MTENTIPDHLRDDRCHVCGLPDHGPTFTDTGDGHDYWSNADARRYFEAESARLSRSGYQEARYVAQYRPY